MEGTSETLFIRVSLNAAAVPVWFLLNNHMLICRSVILKVGSMVLC